MTLHPMSLFGTYIVQYINIACIYIYMLYIYMLYIYTIRIYIYAIYICYIYIYAIYIDVHIMYNDIETKRERLRLSPVSLRSACFCMLA